MTPESPSPRATKRICYVTTRDHAYTFKGWSKCLLERGIDAQALSYEHVLTTPRLRRATYIFTDFDRLSTSELYSAAITRQRLLDGGASVLNDPTRFTPRASLIKRLKQAGINHYDCHMPVAGEWPDRFPVFLRTLAGHRGVLTDLIHDTAGCQQAWDEALAQGHIAMDLAFIEFAAAPASTGHYQKHAAYRVGEHILRATTVNDRHWMAKNGEMGLASAEQYRQEWEEVQDYPLKETIRRVFDIAGLSFGRVDFGMTPEGLQVYEINTNPYLATPSPEHPHPNADRQATLMQIQRSLVDAFDAIAFAQADEWIVIREKRQRVPRI